MNFAVQSNVTNVYRFRKGMFILRKECTLNAYFALLSAIIFLRKIKPDDKNNTLLQLRFF